MQEKLSDYSITLRGRQYKPLMVGGMGVNISSSKLVLAVEKLGGIAHLSDALLMDVCDRELGTHYSQAKTRKFKDLINNPDKSEESFDLEDLAAATKQYISHVMSQKAGRGLVLLNCMEKLTMNAAIDTLRMKNNAYNEAMYYTSSSDGDKQRAAVFDIDQNIIYYAGSYRDANQVLNDVTLIQLTPDGNLLSRSDAREGEWNGYFWDFREVRILDVNQETKEVTESYRDTLSSEKFNKPPKFFREVTKDIAELRLFEAIDWLKELKEANVAKKYRDALIEFYKRFSFTFTTFIVALISCALGSRFNKNILLYSLLISIVTAVVYYVFQMITELFAAGRLLPPFVGSWLPFFTFLILGRVLFRRART